MEKTISPQNLSYSRHLLQSEINTDNYISVKNSLSEENIIRFGNEYIIKVKICFIIIDNTLTCVSQEWRCDRTETNESCPRSNLERGIFIAYL